MYMEILSHIILVQGYKFQLFIVSEKSPTLKFAMDRQTDGQTMEGHYILTFALHASQKSQWKDNNNTTGGQKRQGKSNDET